MKIWAHLVVTSALLLGGCTGRHYETTRITDVIDRSGGSVSLSRIVVAEGLVISAKLTAYDNEDEMMELEVESEDASILEVLPTAGARSRLAFLGRRQGYTRVNLYADGELVESISAQVMP